MFRFLLLSILFSFTLALRCRSSVVYDPPELMRIISLHPNFMNTNKEPEACAVFVFHRSATEKCVPSQLTGDITSYNLVDIKRQEGFTIIASMPIYEPINLKSARGDCASSPKASICVCRRENCNSDAQKLLSGSSPNTAIEEFHSLMRLATFAYRHQSHPDSLHLFTFDLFKFPDGSKPNWNCVLTSITELSPGHLKKVAQIKSSSGKKFTIVETEYKGESHVSFRWFPLIACSLVIIPLPIAHYFVISFMVSRRTRNISTDAIPDEEGVQQKATEKQEKTSTRKELKTDHETESTEKTARNIPM